MFGSGVCVCVCARAPVFILFVLSRTLTPPLPPPSSISVAVQPSTTAAASASRDLHSRTKCNVCGRYVQHLKRVVAGAEDGEGGGDEWMEVGGDQQQNGHRHQHRRLDAVRCASACKWSLGFSRRVTFDSPGMFRS